VRELGSRPSITFPTPNPHVGSERASEGVVGAAPGKMADSRSHGGGLAWRGAQKMITDGDVRRAKFFASRSLEQRLSDQIVGTLPSPVLTPHEQPPLLE
jgi:hypothetical protein